MILNEDNILLLNTLSSDINAQNSSINNKNKPIETNDLMFCFSGLTQVISKLNQLNQNETNKSISHLLRLLKSMPSEPLFDSLRSKLIYFLFDATLNLTELHIEDLIQIISAYVKRALISKDIIFISPLSLLDKLLNLNYQSEVYNEAINLLYKYYVGNSNQKSLDTLLLLITMKLESNDNNAICLLSKVVRLLMVNSHITPTNVNLLLAFLKNGFVLLSKPLNVSDNDDDKREKVKASLIQLFRYIPFDNNSNDKINQLLELMNEITFKTFKSLTTIIFKVKAYDYLMDIIDNDDTILDYTFYDDKENFELNDFYLKERLILLIQVFKRKILLGDKEKAYNCVFNLFFYLTPKFSIEEVDIDSNFTNTTFSSGIDSRNTESSTIMKKRKSISSISLSTSSSIFSISNNKKPKSTLYRLFHSKEILPAIYIDYLTQKRLDDLNQLIYVIIFFHSSPFFYYLLFNMYIGKNFEKTHLHVLFVKLIEEIYNKLKPKYSNDSFFDDIKGINRVNFIILLYKISTQKKNDKKNTNNNKSEKTKMLEPIYKEIIIMLLNNAVLYSNIQVAFKFSTSNKIKSSTPSLDSNSYCYKYLFEIIIEILINLIKNSDIENGTIIGLLKMLMFTGEDLKKQHTFLYEISLKMLVKNYKPQYHFKEYDKLDYNSLMYSRYPKFYFNSRIPHIYYLIKFIMLLGFNDKSKSNNINDTNKNTQSWNKGTSNRNEKVSFAFNTGSTISKNDEQCLNKFFKEAVEILLKELKDIYTLNNKLKGINEEININDQSLYDYVRKEIIASKAKIDLETLRDKIYKFINTNESKSEKRDELNCYIISKFEKDGYIKKESLNSMKEMKGTTDPNHTFNTTICSSMNSEFYIPIKSEKFDIIDYYDEMSGFEIPDNDMIQFPLINTKKIFLYISFGYFFKDITFYNEDFIKIKDAFHNNFNDFYQIEYPIEDLAYPTKLKNFFSRDYKRYFFKPDLRFFNNKYIQVSHSKLLSNIKYSINKDNDNNDRVSNSCVGLGLVNKLKNNSTERGEMLLKEVITDRIKDNIYYSELITIEGAIFGKVNCLHNYIVFKNGPIEEDLRFIIDPKSQKKMKAAGQTLTPTQKAIENKKFGFLSFSSSLNIPTHSSFGINETGEGNSNILNIDISADEEEKSKFEKMNFLMTSVEADVIVKEKTLLIKYEQIKTIITRRFLYSFQAIEIMLDNGRCYFFNLISIEKKEALINYLIAKCPNAKVISNFIDEFKQLGYSDKWLNGQLSTFNYLNLVNIYSCRSFNDANQYPIFPWLQIAQNKKIKQRNFSYPLAVQNDEKRSLILKRKDHQLSSESFQYHLTSHYSTSAFVLFYLVRVNPFTYNMIKLQTGQLDNPNRLFSSLKEMLSILENGNDNRELIPELFYFPDVYLNLNYVNFGLRYDKIMIHQFNLDKTIYNPLDLIITLRRMLESPMVSNEIHKWIDNVFGVCQLDKSKGSCNVFPKYSYQEKMNFSLKIKKKEKMNMSHEKIWEKLRMKISCIQNFGQTPMKLFSDKHPCRSDVASLRSTSSSSSSNESYSIDSDKGIACYNYMSIIGEDINCNSNGNILKCFITSNKSSKKSLLIYDMKRKMKTTIKIQKLLLKYNKLYHLKAKTIKEKDKETNVEIVKTLYIKQSTYLLKNVFDIFFTLNDNKFYIIFSSNVDNTIKIYDVDTQFLHAKLDIESFSTAIKVINTQSFISGHENGKLIHWNINIISDQAKIEISRVKSIINQRTPVILLVYDKKMNIIILSDLEGFVYIRSFKTFELLSVFKPIINSLIQFRLTNIEVSEYEIIYVTAYNQSKNRTYLFAYSVNGVCYSKSCINVYGHIQLLSNSKIMSYGVYNDSYSFAILHPAKLSEVICVLEKEMTDDVKQFYYFKDKGTVMYLDSKGNFYEEKFNQSDLAKLTNDDLPAIYQKSN